jgi:DNA invertase Pin-like site-specific DNA recombinase
LRSKSRFSSSRGARRAGFRSGVPALGYVSVPGDLSLKGPEVEEQLLAIRSACERLGLALVDVVREHEPDGADGRPGLSYTLERLDGGEASCLVVSDLERLTREVAELAKLIDRLERSRVRLVAIDMGLDTATPSGRLAVSPRGSAAQPAELEAEPVGAESGEAVPEPAQPEPAQPEPAAPAEPAVLPVPPAPAAKPATPDGRPAVPAAAAALRAIGYASIPSEGNGTAELDAQRRAIERSAERLGLELVEVVREREPGKGRALDRAGLSYLIERVAAGDASCVVVGGLERLSRSVAELGTIVQWLERNRVRLVAVDMDLDTADPGGRATAQALASVAGWERERLSERTRKGLAAARSKRHASGTGADTGWSDIRKRIAAMRADGMTLQAIADVLNKEGVPTPRGGTEWRPSSVQTAAGYKRRTRSKKVEDLPQVDSPGPPGGAKKGGDPGN